MKTDSIEFIAEQFAASGYVVHQLWDTPRALVEETARKSDKPTVILWVADDEQPLDVPSHVWVFRTSLAASRKSAQEFLLPYVFEPMARCRPLEPGPKPRVSFCGFATSHPVRTASLVNLIDHQTQLELALILREQFWAGKPHDQHVVKEFVANMQQSEFNVCMRGQGNFSMRFYQTLAAGRIPVVVDTDMVWPFPDLIAWEDVCVISRCPQDVAADVLRFWRTRDIVNVQQRCADTYDRYFRNPNVSQLLLKIANPERCFDVPNAHAGKKLYA